MQSPTRRGLLRQFAAGAAVAGVAGCSLFGPPCGTSSDAPRAAVAPGESLGSLPEGAAWPMGGGDAGRTRSTAAAGPVEDVVLTWRFDAADRPGVGVAVADGRLYAVGDALYALDPVAERVVWRYRPSDPGVDAKGVAVAREEGLAVLGTADGLHAVDVESADVQWRYGSGGLRPAAVSGGSVYALGADGLHAVDAATGERRFADDGSSKFLGVADGRVVVAEPLRALDAADGTELWRVDVDPSLTFETGPGAVADGSVFLVFDGPGDRRFAQAVDATDGTERWRYRAEELENFQAPAYARGTLVLGSYNSEHGGAHVHALDAATGEGRWTVDLGCAVEAPAVAGGVVYVAAWGTVQARRLDDGELVWYHEHETPCDWDFCEYGPPIVVGGALLARSSTGAVHVFAER